MKANKALKRLGKIEALMSDLAERFSASAPHLREALKDLNAAVVSVKAAVSVQTSGAAKKKAAAKKSAPVKPSLVKKAAVKAVKAKAAKKRAPVRKAAKKRVPKRVGRAPLQVAAAAGGKESLAGPTPAE